MTEKTSNPTQSKPVAKLVTDVNELMAFSSQEVPSYRPDLQMKVAQEVAARAMSLTSELVNVIALLDSRLIAVEGANNG